MLFIIPFLVSCTSPTITAQQYLNGLIWLSEYRISDLLSTTKSATSVPGSDVTYPTQPKRLRVTRLWNRYPAR